MEPEVPKDDNVRWLFTLCCLTLCTYRLLFLCTVFHDERSTLNAPFFCIEGLSFILGPFPIALEKDCGMHEV